MNEYFSANPPGITELLQGKSAFIAGAGGLGSNVAMILVRAGLGKMTVADFDTVSPSNLNRQQFTRAQVGTPKTIALEQNILAVNPELIFSGIKQRLGPDNFGELIPQGTDIVFECFDNAQCKAELVRHCLANLPGTPLVAVSGVAGLGPVSDIRISRRGANLYLVGDGETDVGSGAGTIASRVTLVAAAQAHTGIRLLCGLSAE